VTDLPHADLYGSEAFFDLERTGPQTKVADRLANELSVGESCIVATPDSIKDITCDITFDWYRFSTSKSETRPKEERGLSRLLWRTLQNGYSFPR
jgi:hypothetical protein